MSCDESDPDCVQSVNLLHYEKQFVITFEKLPVLWDKRHKHYFNKFKRLEALEKLVVIYRNIKHYATVDDVKRKINSLRSNYRRELRKILLYRRSGGEYVPKSWIFNYLHFLSNEPSFVKTLEQDDRLDLEYSESTEEQIEEPFQNYTQPSCSFSTVDEPSTSTRKWRPQPSNAIWQSTPPKLNIIAMYWMEKLERLPNTQRIFAEKAINDILCEAGLGNLNKFSVKINEPSKYSLDKTKSSV